MSVHVRKVEPRDADQMIGLLNTIIETGGTTAYTEPFDQRSISDYFIANDFGISCFVAIEGEEILGFQSIEWPDPNWPGEDKMPQDWAIISTYVDVKAHKKGIGSKLFEYTLNAAREASVTKINARIKKENEGGQVYYSKIGFIDYQIDTETISKSYAIKDNTDKGKR